MCIALNKPENVLVPHKYLKECWDHNDDGAGFMYAEDGELHIYKGYMNFDSFMEEYTPHEHKPCVLHFRITTHGNTNQTNTHPFRVGPNLGFVHNGIISNVDCSADKTLSDTNHFNTSYLKKLYEIDPTFIFNPLYQDLLKGFIGGSKLIFLDNNGQSVIVNEKAGKWDEGVWYSNSSYMPRPVVAPRSTYTPPQTDTRMPSHITFKQGTKVYVKHPRMRGQGVIQYFTGNSMVGVLMQGDTQASLFPMECLHLYNEKAASPFKHDDFVIRKTDTMLQTGIVKGTSKQTVWVQWLDDYMIPQGHAKAIAASELELWDYPLGI